MKKLIVLLSIFFLKSPIYLFAAGETGAEFLKLGAGVRALGMGGAFTAVADDVSATFWNPAGLPLLRQNEILLMHDEYLFNINYDCIGYAIPIGQKYAFGGELHYVYVNDIRSYDNYGNPGKNLSAYDSMISFSGSYALVNNKNQFLGTGSTLKFIQQKLVDERAQAFALDTGYLYKFFKKKLSVGLTIRNFEFKRPRFSKESAALPLEYRVGTSCEFPFKTINFLVSSDLVIPYKEITYGTSGIELTFWDLFNIRAGYRFAKDEGSGISMGTGIIFKRMGIDYAFIPFGDLGDTHKVSISIKFGTFKKDTIAIGNEERASIHYERAIKFMEEGDSIAAAYELDVCLKFYANYRDAQLLLDSKVHYFYSRGVEAYEDEKYEEAVKWSNLALRYNPKHTDAQKLKRKAQKYFTPVEGDTE